MKRLSLQLGVACLTFSLGVGLTLIYLRLVLLSSVPSKSVISSTQITLPSQQAFAESVRIILKRSFRDGRNLAAEFEVINGGSDALYYTGYGEGDNRLWNIMRGNRSKRYPQYLCGTGLSDHALLPGESVTFKVFIENAGNMKVGFDFYTKGERLPIRHTIWSDDVYIPEE